MASFASSGTTQARLDQQLHIKSINVWRTQARLDQKKEEEEEKSRWKQWPASLRPPPRVAHASTPGPKRRIMKCLSQHTYWCSSPTQKSVSLPHRKVFVSTTQVWGYEHKPERGEKTPENNFFIFLLVMPNMRGNKISTSWVSPKWVKSNGQRKRKR